MKKLRVALVHDWLIDYGGAEQVLGDICELFPDADIFTLIDRMSAANKGQFARHRIHTSWLSSIPKVERIYRRLLPLMPAAIESFDLSDYDLVISSSFAVSKGVRTGPKQLHVCYCHSPARYAWDQEGRYLREAGPLVRLLALPVSQYLSGFRTWDYRSAQHVDVFLSNSHFVSRRIAKCYRRRSTVVHPGCRLPSGIPGDGPRKGFITASRLVPYKKIDLIVRAFARLPELELTVLGDGPQRRHLEAIATSNVKIRGRVPVDELHGTLAGAQAFLFAAEEDFGIAPLEAQALGLPVLAYGSGGSLETVQDGISGLFFHEQSVDAIVDIVQKFLAVEGHFDRAAIASRVAIEFSARRFKDEFGAAVEAVLLRWRAGVGDLACFLDDPGHDASPSSCGPRA